VGDILKPEKQALDVEGASGTEGRGPELEASRAAAERRSMAAEDRREEREVARRAAEAERVDAEQTRAAAEDVRRAAEEARNATEKERAAIVESVRDTADALAADLAQMQFMEDARSIYRDLKDVKEPDSK
jgi:acyl-CoA reductase-like NAD-dependent aldehyde dehydrogenase